MASSKKVKNEKKRTISWGSDFMGFLKCLAKCRKHCNLIEEQIDQTAQILWTLGSILCIYIYIYIYIYKSKVSQYVVMCNTVGQLWMLLLKFWRWWTTLDWEVLSSPDTLSELLTRFYSIVWSIDAESTVLGLPYLAWSLRFLLLYCNEWHLLQNKYFSAALSCTFELVMYKFLN